MLLPLVGGVAPQTKQDMMSFIWGVGHGAVDAVFKAEADALLGPAGKRKEGRARQNGSLDWLPTGGGSDAS